MPVDTITQLNKLFELQKKAFQLDPYPSVEVRIERIKRIPPMLKKYRSKIHAALDQDFGGHSDKASDLLEIIGLMDRAEFIAKNVKRWMKPKKKSGNLITLGNAKIYLKSHPKGTIGNMVSWNFPFEIALGPTIDALAAGNRVIIKPSDLGPACGAVLEEMINDTFDRDLVAVVNGDLELAKHFPTLPWDHLIYTGSGHVGKLVMAAASKNLVPVTLELGGKSPVIVHKDAVNNETIKSIASIKSVKRGQMCVTGDYCLVHSSKINEFVEKISAQFKNDFGADNNGAAHTCGIISEKHLMRLHSLIEDAENKGAKVINTGQENKENKRHMPFYVIVNPTREMKVMQEEIFGPILPIISYDTTDEVIQFINEDDHPLGLYIYGNDKPFINKICKNTQSGGVAINVIAIQAGVPSLPFGGIGASGMGMHHGEEGFREFSNQRGYFHKRKGGVYNIVMSPYGQKTDKLINDVAYASLGKQALFALKTLPRNIAALIGF